ncbi:transposable element tcb1 transposase [Vespula squamosa]|uniref:Transposable element tcb1 transposase n=1 Tax=Vespula squamosa TaxID=30214 RepID=A0ABD2B9H8_VESSQ
MINLILQIITKSPVLMFPKISNWFQILSHVGNVPLIDELAMRRRLKVTVNLKNCLASANHTLINVCGKNNDPKQTPKKTKEFLQDCEIKDLEWLSQRGDLNPIKNL